MGQIITLLCAIRILFWRMMANNFCYAFFRRGCKWVNKSITERAAPHLFAVLKYYLNFGLYGDEKSKELLPEQYLVISNHQSIFDIVAYMCFLKGDNMKFMAKYELINHIPLVSVMLKTGDHCIVKRRGSPSQAMKAIDKFANSVKNSKHIPVIFPEGTRSKDGRLQTFYSAGVRRFLNSQALPVAVCALDGGYKISSLKAFIRGIKGDGYKMKVLKVFQPPATKEAQLAMLDEAKTLIDAQLKEWRG